MEARRVTSRLYLLKAFQEAGGGQNPDLWVNLGVYYLQGGHHRQAIEAFGVALSLDPRNHSAVGGLARAYEGLGDFHQAAEYDSQLSRYRKRNPYYHFARAQLAFGERRYAESLDILKRAIRLRDDDHRFYNLQGMTFRELGNLSAARSSWTKALEESTLHWQKKRYTEVLAAVND